LKASNNYVESTQAGTLNAKYSLRNLEIYLEAVNREVARRLCERYNITLRTTILSVRLW